MSPCNHVLAKNTVAFEHAVWCFKKIILAIVHADLKLTIKNCCQWSMIGQFSNWPFVVHQTTCYFDPESKLVKVAQLNWSYFKGVRRNKLKKEWNQLSTQFTTKNLNKQHQESSYYNIDRKKQKLYLVNSRTPQSKTNRKTVWKWGW